jgi:argininosuccinate lyase
VQYAIARNKDLSEITLQEFHQFSKKIAKDVFACLTLEGSVAARAHIGGTAPVQIRKAIKRGQQRLQKVIKK